MRGVGQAGPCPISSAPLRLAVRCRDSWTPWPPRRCRLVLRRQALPNPLARDRGYSPATSPASLSTATQDPEVELLISEVEPFGNRKLVNASMASAVLALRIRTAGNGTRYILAEPPSGYSSCRQICFQEDGW
ncbi:39S ribosomal protein L27, mitochondrial isoform X3 [Sapajus apella]|uniref:39S ribosomal protein L27, mitochondrial isoform X3 n=1 Tax=Sapajus apella TaxID=9515 RepID=A0A6J3I0T0_SAPAP|nr:39S ribosomal protein L27, mitochondrial isoform X3 [Sapajus apella]